MTSTLHIGMKPYLKAGDRFVTLTFTSGRMSATVRLQQHVDGVPGDLGEWGDQNIPVDVVPVAFSMQPGRIVMDYGFYRFGAKVYMDSNYPIYFKGYIVNGELTTDGSNLPAWLPKPKYYRTAEQPCQKDRIHKVRGDGRKRASRRDAAFPERKPDPGFTGHLRQRSDSVYDAGHGRMDGLSHRERPGHAVQSHRQQRYRQHPAAGDKSLPWSTDKQSVGGTATGFNTAQANMLAVTRFYISTSNKIPAFTECRTMGYGNVWLFSRDELQVLLKYNLMLGPSYRFAPQSELLSSSEVDQNNAYTVKYNGPGSVSSYSRDKNGSYIVRCVRAF